jgi:hypothetical protein
MEKVITVDIADKNDLVEKYDRSIVSADLIKFILTQSEQASIRDTFKIIVKDKCHLDHDVSNLIRSGIKIEYDNAVYEHTRNNNRQILSVIIGVILIVISTIIKDPVLAEIFAVGAWVAMWDAIELALYSEYKERRKMNRLRKLLNCEIVSD